jgi:hypothetical protein
MTYDAKGNMIERRIYGSDGAPKGRTVRSLDGRDTTEFYDSEGRPIWKQVSVHDDDGKPTEVKVYRDGSLSWIREMTYDAGGNLAETRQSFYDDSGSLRSKEVMKFDNRSNRAESAGYAADGSLSGRTVMTYDAKGNMIESIRYDGAGSVEEAWQYTHEFDPVGNWIRQVQSQAITEADGVRFVPTSVYYRTITYYPETKKPAAEKAEPPKSKQ